MKRKAFTIVELLVVIAILAILSTVSIFGYTRFIKNANESADMTLLTQINRSLTAAETIGETNTVNDVYNLLYNNGLNDSNLIAKQEGYEFVYNKETNRFEYLETGWKDEVYSVAKTNYELVTDWRNSFGATINGKKVTGYKQFTGSTTFTYKYLTSDNDVIVGDTITEDNTLIYFLHVPENYDSRISYPIITYIHGSGGCLYYQKGGMGFEQITDNSFFDNKSYAMKWLKGNDTNVYTHLYNGSMKQAGGDGAFGNWDNPFAIEWFKWVKEHPEDDAFFIFVQLNDETWFENNAEYTYTKDGDTYNNLTGLCIANACLAGTQDETYYGSYVNGITSKWRNDILYKSYYNSSELGENVWFQLLTQSIDKLAEEYNIDLNRQYVMGASLGGISTYDLVSHNPDRFAAAFPCAAPCADISDENVARIANGKTVIRAYHGSSDGLVDPAPSKTLCEKIATAGGDAVFKSEPGGHSSEYLTNNFEEIMNVIRNTSRKDK